MNKFEWLVNPYTCIVRINKKQARKTYDNGLPVLFSPVNMDPLKRFCSLAIWESKDLDGQYNTFDALVNAYEYYNCNSETGNYTAFYVPYYYADRFSDDPLNWTLANDGYYHNAVKSYDVEYLKRQGIIPC